GVTSIRALTKPLGGDRDAANAIVANFANKFFFEVDDKATRELARELIGQSVVLRRAKTEATSRSQGSSGHPNGDGSHSSSGTPTSESLNEHLEEVVDGSVWRALGADRDHATAIAYVRTPTGVKTDVVLLGVLDPTDGILTALPAGYELSP
ncbi:MAG: TraM recognition domain-containing protein, partial [Vulcanimicrobiaceae bacterium]